jgi:peptide/nickel transport system substrate-binding protein
MFSVSYAEDASWNDSNWKHERFNKLLKEARAELNEAKRREMYVEMQRITRDEGGVIVHIFKDYIEATNKKIGHGPIAGNWFCDGARMAERWWFES